MYLTFDHSRQQIVILTTDQYLVVAEVREVEGKEQFRVEV
jgi:hypothetical protein